MSLSILFLCSCSEKIDTRTPEEKWSDHCQQLKARIIVTFGTKMWKEKGLEPIGAGGGGDGTRTRMLSMDFRCCEKVDIVQARKLLLECVQEFLSEINKNQEIESCFTVFPFTYKNINIRIFFYEKFKNFKLIHFPCVAIAKAYEGQLRYDALKGEDFETVKEEFYEEALQIAGQN